MTMSTPNIENLTNEALDAFWSVIAKQVPQATTGDLSPGTDFALQVAAENAVKEWIAANVP